MLTPEQEVWIAHLNDSDCISIYPYDPKSETIFEQVRADIFTHCSSNLTVEHHGSSALKISGQNEIDIYIPVLVSQFDNTVALLTGYFGAPKSLYPFLRARFSHSVADKKTDIFVVNKESKEWNNHITFIQYLKSHSDALERYRVLKEHSAGMSTRAYYREKVSFINEILRQAEEAPTSQSPLTGTSNE